VKSSTSVWRLKPDSGRQGVLSDLTPFLRFAALAAALSIVAASSASVGAASSILRVEVHLVPGARTSPHLVLMTVGGPIYCMQLANLARNVNASLLCADYGPNRYVTRGGRAGRREDWGDPAYDAAVAQLPAKLRSEGVKISKLVMIGVSYSGFANAELVATHPEMRADALIVVDSYLDLPARYGALIPNHETQTEIEAALGGTLAEKPRAYAQRSPSHHLVGLARGIRDGLKLVVVWSVSPEERREFLGATCSLQANAQWLSQLAGVLGTPVVGYVTHLPHAHALWDRGQALLELAGIGRAPKPLLARPVAFRPGGAIPATSYCS
jgi:pimeloyl-ACP methyl ester carboxylesterase